MEKTIKNIEDKEINSTTVAKDVIVEMEHLQKSFGENHVLKDIHLQVKKGETEKPRR